MINKDSNSHRQIVHEAEITRQHTRYKIPAQLEIEDIRYKVADWSLSGCAIEGLPTEFCSDNRCRVAKLIFTFDNFTTIVDSISIDFICKDQRNGATGGRFHNLNASQLAILHQIITAFLNGDILTQGDIIHAVSKQITYPKKVAKKVERKRADILLVLIYFTIGLLISFLLFVGYQRFFVVQTANGYIDTKLVVIRSPYPSYINFLKPFKAGDNIDLNETIAVAYFIGGGVATIKSVAKGNIYKIDISNNQFRDKSEPIMTLISKNSKAYILAYINHKDFKKIKIGDKAKVRLINGDIIKANIKSISPMESIDFKHAKVLSYLQNQVSSYDKLLLKPLKPLKLNLLNTTVFVTIDTLLQ